MSSLQILLKLERLCECCEVVCSCACAGTQGTRHRTVRDRVMDMCVFSWMEKWNDGMENQPGPTALPLRDEDHSQLLPQGDLPFMLRVFSLAMLSEGRVKFRIRLVGTACANRNG